MSHYLILRLEGPLQSWGLRARWDVRDSGSEPTKSGVIGLLGCAMGIPRGDPHLEKLDAELRFATRIDHPGRFMVDFHTITGVLPQANGKTRGKPDAPSTIISPRTYLQDAAFLVILEGQAGLLSQCCQALCAPKWPLYLGRKACIPTRPVFDAQTSEYESLEEVAGQWPWSIHAAWLAKENPPGELRAFIEDTNGDYRRPDAIRVNTARMYGERRMRLLMVGRPDVEKEEVSCFSPA